mmetsp:Transcript_26710/g.62744  ORF Transcript_26710/g.62744 Transcript_26710/m.62744 type:complete len:240 (-) Transcript_26710:96-815(-)
MRGVLLEHDPPQNAGVVQLPAGDLFDLGVSLEVDGRPRSGRGLHDRHHGLDGHVDELIVPTRRELRADAAQDELRDPLRVLLHVDRYGQVVADFQSVGQRLRVRLAEDGRMVLVHQEGFRRRENLRAQHDHGGRSVPDFFVLSPRQLDHGFRGRVAHVDLTEDAVPVVRHDDPAHRIQQHLEHRLRTEGRPNDVGDRYGGADVAQLGLAAGLPLGFGVQHHDLSRTGGWSHHRHGRKAS